MTKTRKQVQHSQFGSPDELQLVEANMMMPDLVKGSNKYDRQELYRMQEIQNPKMSLDGARENWQKLGRSEKCLPVDA